MSEGGTAFRFQAFADAPAAQAAFEAAYPLGSPVEAALQALVDMGAHCKAVSPSRFACRYVEAQQALAGWCWHVALEGDAEKRIRRSSVGLSILGV
jgi:hypothetical protein